MGRNLETTPKPKRQIRGKDVTTVRVPSTGFGIQSCTGDMGMGKFLAARRETPCVICSETIHHFRSEKRIVCSFKCRSIKRTRDARVSVACGTCSDKFSARRSARRKYCSSSCAGTANQKKAITRYGADTSNYKGDKASKWAFYKRANKLKEPGPCERCEKAGQVVHHIDHNPRNNSLENLERLCRACHARHHAEERRRKK